MANDDLLVRNAIERLGVNASIEWIRQCIAYHRTLDAANSTTASERDIAQFAWDMYLLADFRILDPKPMLPNSVATPHKQRLFKDVGGEDSVGGGGAVLQILEIHDIGISSFKMLEACEAVGVAGDQPGGFLVEKTLPRGMISLEVTDGVRKMSAILMDPIAGIAMEMKLGAKIRVRDAEVRHGVLQLFRSNTTLLGGEIASMNQHPRRLTIMNQMKKRLGLPLDPMPTTSNNTSPASETLVISKPTLQSTVPSFGINSGVNISNNTTSVASFNSGWKNPQSAVSSLDAVPSIATLPNPQQPRNPFMASRESEARPQIQQPNPVRKSRSPPPPPMPMRSKANQHQEEMDTYRQMQRDQEPQWDLMQELELDDISRDGPADWEVMSQLSVEGSNKHKEKSIDRDSPPLIATKSPAKRGLLTRRTTSLRSPHSQHQKSQQQLLEKSRDSSWEVETNPFLNDSPTQKRSRSIESEDAAKTRRGAAGLDYVDLSRGSSPLRGSPRALSRKRPLQSSPLKAKAQLKLDLATNRDFDFQVDDAYTANIRFENGFDEDYGLQPPPPPAFDHGLTGHDDDSPKDATEWEDGRGREVGKKRRVSPERESADQDLYSNRRRSRSFSTSHWIEEDVKLEVKVEKDSKRYDGELDAQEPDAAVKSEKDGTVQRFGQVPIDDISSRVRPVSPELSNPKIEAEPGRSMEAQGLFNNGVIDLSSDEDDQDDNEGAATKAARRDRDVRGLDIHPVKIKADPEDSPLLSRTKIPIASVPTPPVRRSLSRSNSVQSVGQATEPLVYVKKEETLLEFDFEDGDDFGGLVERTRLIPEVELNHVKSHVLNKEEVKARAHVHKLGKFSLTTQAVSIPIFLLPAKSVNGNALTPDESPTKTVLEAVLEQSVVEPFTELSLGEFRDLLRFKNENKVMEAVKKLRTRLGMADTVECQFRGMRSGILVVRDLKILTEKRH
ncbi:recQ-mediated genome instability protein 1 [Mortierella alpina]|uniref:RecQ-mediated genome instability protein 1 n=1 Tax=Mortierella alpina TaxID=64518 RepID=A0A9P6IXS9_MORAP|nr:recQ-mediated genome instability protein 1 [Mortierella alpina]